MEKCASPGQVFIRLFSIVFISLIIAACGGGGGGGGGGDATPAPQPTTPSPQPAPQDTSVSYGVQLSGLLAGQSTSLRISDASGVVHSRSYSQNVTGVDSIYPEAFEVEVGDYTAQLSDVPPGYDCVVGHDLTSDGPLVEITCLDHGTAISGKLEIGGPVEGAAISVYAITPSLPNVQANSLSISVDGQLQASASSAATFNDMDLTLEPLFVEGRAADREAILVPTDAQTVATQAASSEADSSGDILFAIDSRLADHLRSHASFVIVSFSCPDRADWNSPDNPCRLRPRLHALMTPAQFLDGGWEVNALTETVYRELRYPLLAGYSDTQLTNYLAAIPDTLLRDEAYSSLGATGYDALLAWRAGGALDHLIKKPSKVRAAQDTLQNSPFSSDYFDYLAGEVIGPSVGILPSVGIKDVAKNGDWLYLADDSDLAVVDISDLEAPVEAGSVNLSTFANAVAANGDYALAVYATNGGVESGFKVVNVATPSSPTVIATAPTPGYARDVAVSSGTAVVADSNAGLQIYDITTPASPVLLGTYVTAGSVQRVVLHGSYAVIANSTNGLQIVDISVPATPVLVGSASARGDSSAIAVEGDVAYIADAGGYLSAFDISDPSNPSAIDEVAVPGELVDVAVRGDAIFVVSDNHPYSQQNGALHYFRLTGSNKLNIARVVRTPHDTRAIEADSDFLYVASAGGNEGLQVFDADYIDAPTFSISQTRTSGFARGVAVHDQRAYVSDMDGIRIIDVSDPASPVVLGGVNTPGEAEKATVLGGYAYVADGNNGLQTVDVSVPANPAMVGHVNTSGYAWSVEVEDGVAYIADYSGGLQLADITDPTNPLAAGNGALATCAGLVGSNYAHDVAVDGGLAYVAANNCGLHIYDVSNYMAPSLITAFDDIFYSTGQAVTYQGGDVYYAQTNGIFRVDVSVPASPVTSSQTDTPRLPADVAVSGDILYVADYLGGIEAIDLNSSEPHKRLGGLRTDNWLPSSVVAVDGYLYVADGYGGLLVFKALP